MHRSIAQATILLCSVLSLTFAQPPQGTALVTIGGAVAKVDMPGGTLTELVNKSQFGTSWKDAGSFNGPCLSPDGKQIAFLAMDWYGSETDDVRRWMIYIADNDGSHRDSICETYSNDMHNASCMSWPNDGYLWWSEDDDRIYRVSLSTRQREVVASLSDFTGPVPTKVNNLKMSLDGTRGGCMVNGTSQGAFALDFTLMETHTFGTGGCQGTVSPNGQLGTHNTSGADGYSHHQVAYIHDWDTDSIVYTLHAPGAVPGGSGSLPRFVFHRFSHSSNDYIVWSGEDALGGQGYVHDLDDDTAFYLGECKPYDFWVGDLPAPPSPTPHIALSPTSLDFTSTGGATPAAQTVNVTNSGVGTLTTVTVQGDPAWLTVTPGGSDNAQTLENAVSISGLSPGIHEATISVSGGGAGNTATYTVTLNIATTLLAPGGLSASGLGADSAALSWTDNSDNEEGFAVERAVADGAWEHLISVAADAVSYVDVGLAAETMYHYRVRAFAAGDSSGWSNEDSLSLSLVKGITMTAPHAGTPVIPGDTLHIIWTTVNVTQVDLLFTVDQGETMQFVYDESIDDQDSLWGDYAWVVPPMSADTVLLMIQEYSNPIVADWSDPLPVESSGAVAAPAAATPSVAILRATVQSDGTVSVAYHGAASGGSVSLCAMDGRQLASRSLGASRIPQTCLFHDMSQGMYLVIVRPEDGRVMTERVVVR